jgi:hypothetical protein
VALSLAPPAVHKSISRKDRLTEGAAKILQAIEQIRSPEYMIDYKSLLASQASTLGQFPGAGGGSPPTLILTSWSQSPFDQLQSNFSGGQSEPVFIQPSHSFTRMLPVPRGHLTQAAICWRGKVGGYWLAANFADDLWDEITNMCLDESNFSSI